MSKNNNETFRVPTTEESFADFARLLRRLEKLRDEARECSYKTYTIQAVANMEIGISIESERAAGGPIPHVLSAKVFLGRTNHFETSWHACITNNEEMWKRRVCFENAIDQLDKLYDTSLYHAIEYHNLCSMIDKLDLSPEQKAMITLENPYT